VACFRDWFLASDSCLVSFGGRRCRAPRSLPLRRSSRILCAMSASAPSRVTVGRRGIEAPSTPGELAAHGPRIDPLRGDISQTLVGPRFLFQRLLQQLGDLAMAQLLGERARRAVARDLVMLDALRGSDERRVTHPGIALGL